MATQPAPSPRTDPIAPTIPGELPPVITPDQAPGEPAEFPEVGPDSDVPDSAAEELPEV